MKAMLDNAFVQCDRCKEWASATQLQIDMPTFEKLAAAPSWMCDPCIEALESARQRAAKQKRNAIHARLYEDVMQHLRPGLPELVGFLEGPQEGGPESDEDNEEDMAAECADVTEQQVVLEREIAMLTLPLALTNPN